MEEFLNCVFDRYEIL